MRLTFALLCTLCVLLAIRPARALDTFEIQVYDGTANAVAVPAVELHLNDWATGHRTATAPELPLNSQFHATLEPSVGLFPFWELGAYLQSALRADGTFDYAGTKLRSKFVTPPGWNAHWRLGFNLEVSYVPATDDRDRWAAELRPIVAWQDARWLFAFNPIVDQSLAGDGASDGPSFEPAFKAARSLGLFALGFEYYGSLAAPLRPADQAHYVYEVIDWLSLDHVEINAGVGEGLTTASAGIVVKAILGYTFDGVATQPRRMASNASRAHQ
jgi:hypothetical protein